MGACSVCHKNDNSESGCEWKKRCGDVEFGMSVLVLKREEGHQRLEVEGTIGIEGEHMISVTSDVLLALL